MGRFIVIVLDSFGVGEMKDVSIVRPRDIGSNTALHIIEKKPDIKIPTLVSLGLMNSIGIESGNLTFSPSAVYGTSNLEHIGADSFLGHQEIMGTRPKIPLNQPFNEKIDEVERHLLENRYKVRRFGDAGDPQILVVNECATVGDNLETDLGQVYNVSACLDLMPFEEVKALGRCVREVVQVSRVITFGGKQIGLNNLLNAKKVKNGEFAGVDAPESGVYKHGYEVVHLGYGIDPNVQLPTIMDKAGMTISLSGKFADIIQTSTHRVFSGVDTEKLFQHFQREIEEVKEGLLCLNIQETDLAGHSEDTMRYADVLEISDRCIKQILPMLTRDDIMIIMADHGNDPTIGHSNHTREKVPLLIYKKDLKNVYIGERDTMADVAATAAEYFNVSKPQYGTSFLSKLYS